MTESNRIEYKRELTDSLEKEVGGKQTAKKGSGKSSPKSSPKTEDEIIDLIRKNSTITTERLGENLGITKRAVLKQIEKLKKAGRLKRIGPAKGGHWGVIRQKD